MSTRRPSVHADARSDRPYPAINGRAASKHRPGYTPAVETGGSDGKHQGHRREACRQLRGVPAWAERLRCGTRRQLRSGAGRRQGRDRVPSGSVRRRRPGRRVPGPRGLRRRGDRRWTSGRRGSRATTSLMPT